jgi:hypothetical protein
MSGFAGKLTYAIVLGVLIVGAPAARAQVAPVGYWLPGSLFGFGGSLADGRTVDTYGNFPTFDGGAASAMGTNFPTGWFIGGEGGRFGFSGLGQSGAFGSYNYQGTQVGYNFQGIGGSPVTFYAGFDSLKYNAPGIGGPIAPFSTTTGTNAGFAARAGLEFHPTSNVSLSLGASFVQPQSERMDSDINSPLLPGQSPLFYGR